MSDRELALFANTEAEYTAAITRWSEISRQIGTEFIAVFDIPVDHALEAELDQIYKAT